MSHYRDNVLVKEEVLMEAKALRQHKGRLEARMQILEDHNRQLESQLHRLRNLLEADQRTVTNGNGFSNGNHGEDSMRVNGHRSDGKRI